MKYDDIINLERPVSKFPKLSDSSRAAQFSPFAALTGYEDDVKEVARYTCEKIILDDGLKDILDYKINYLNHNIKNNNVISVIYFVKDERKDGGKYVQVTGVLKKIDFVKKNIRVDNEIIGIENIYNITGDVFNDL